MKAPLPVNEAERLKALAEYHILDSAPEQGFDDLAKLATEICGCPIAVMSLIDAERQWFKARVGIEGMETSRDQAFCAHAILDPQNLMVVSDATRDQRFCDNPAVMGDPNIRFYAGTPLLTHEGLPLGTLCVIDRKPRQLAPGQLHSLRILGRQMSYLLELRRVTRELARVIAATRKA
jgi:adenylate cyclase